MSERQKYFILTFMALGQGAVFFLPYLRIAYYEALLGTLQITNAELGSLVSFFGLAVTFLLIPGGILADKLNYKKCIVWSLVSTGLLVASFSFFLNFAYARIVYFLLAFTTTLVFWSATIKAVRAMGTEENQGKTYGFFYTAQGGLSIIIATIFLYVFNRVDDPELGLRVVLLGNAAVNLLAALVCQLLLPNPSQSAPKSDKNNDAKTDDFDFKKIAVVVKDPLMYLLVIMIFCTYGLYQNSFYYSTYLVSVKGMDTYWASQLSLIRVTYMMALMPIVGGFFADKLKSTAKLYFVGACAAGLSVFGLMAIMSSDMNIFALGALSILPSAFMLMIYAISGSLYSEFGVPLAINGTAIGLVSTFAYMPDVFFGPLLGGWLDTQGNDGYNTIFMFFGFLTIACAVASLLAIRINSTRKLKIAT